METTNTNTNTTIDSKQAIEQASKPKPQSKTSDYEQAMLKALHSNKDFVANILATKKRVKKDKQESNDSSLKSQCNKDFKKLYNRLVYCQDELYKPIYRLLVYGVHQQKDETQKLASMAKAKELLKTYIKDVQSVLNGSKDKDIPDRT